MIDTQFATRLNHGCACRFLDPALLRAQLESDPALAGMAEDIAVNRPHLFSPTMVFISPAQQAAMQAVVSAVELVVALPAWQLRTLADAPDIAQRDHGPRGVFLGFDFHMSADGPQLIEINTNAGGALLNTALLRAQQACCATMDDMPPTAVNATRAEADMLAMFIAEWRAQRGDSAVLQRIAIVDDAPGEQYLYPEFRLFQQLFTRAGIAAVIADPRDLHWQGGRLMHADGVVDLVYNRLTDFTLEEPAHAALRTAFEADAVVLTPHPRAHALYADKRNLALLSDDAVLREMGVSESLRLTLLAGIPATEIVTPARADALWQNRRQLFFKPAGGFGGRAAYRGDKLTRRVWDEILAGNYVAQRIAVPSERVVATSEATTLLKLDVRAYAYAGQVQLLAARLYQGQTTNFRTPGGGFAPVFVADAPVAFRPPV